MLPPIRAARATIGRMRTHLRPLGARWEHLETPIPVERPRDFVVSGESDAKIVTRLVRSASPGFPTRVTDGDFEAAMAECLDADCSDQDSLPLSRPYSGPETQSRAKRDVIDIKRPRNLGGR